MKVIHTFTDTQIKELHVLYQQEWWTKPLLSAAWLNNPELLEFRFSYSDTNPGTAIVLNNAQVFRDDAWNNGFDLRVVSLPPNLVISDAVFAHDFENIAGNHIASLIGPNAVKGLKITADTSDPISPFSSKHVQAPIGDQTTIAWDHINTQTQLTSPTSALSFTIQFNSRGDNGSEFANAARLLSSFNGTGFPPNDFVFDTSEDPAVLGMRWLRFAHNPGSGTVSVFSESGIPTRDNTWDQVGFVFEGGVSDGTVTFYFDGSPLGSPIVVPGLTQISAPNLGWYLIEDQSDVSNKEEFFDNGDYDEAALWYRALSSTEMQALYSQGIVAASVATDSDGDGIPDDIDNCLNDENPFQENNDGDEFGDVCDTDDDNDNVDDISDNCPLVENELQQDYDLDGLGNACDTEFSGNQLISDIETIVLAMRQTVLFENPPGGNGMISKLTGKGGILQKVGNAITSFGLGETDVETYLSHLHSALDKLEAFDNQLAAKVKNDHIGLSAGSQLGSSSAAIRVIIMDLISAVGS